MTSNQLVNHLCYEYGTTNINEERLEALHEIKKELKALKIIKENLNIDEILLAVKGVCKASDYDLVKEVLTNE